MSIWTDIHRRSNGNQIRKEDTINNAWLADDIKVELKSMKVGPGLHPPVRMFIITVRDRYTDIYKTISQICTSTFHPDGSRDYCTDENVSKILKIIGDNEYIEMC